MWSSYTVGDIGFWDEFLLCTRSVKIKPELDSPFQQGKGQSWFPSVFLHSLSSQIYSDLIWEFRICRIGRSLINKSDIAPFDFP